jgi:hypothetical protein
MWMFWSARHAQHSCEHCLSIAVAIVIISLSGFFLAGAGFPPRPRKQSIHPIVERKMITGRSINVIIVTS